MLVPFLKKVTVLAGAFALIGVQGAMAVNLPPGSLVGLPGSTTSGTTELTSSRALIGLDVFSNVMFTGTLNLAIVRAGGGTLDFYYQVMNDASSANSIKRVTTTDFDGWAVDADWSSDTSGPYSTGTRAPSRGDRSLDGSVVGFGFISTIRGGFGDLLPGETSKWFFIKTDAIHWNIGSTSVIDGGIATVSSYTPSTTPVPEPATFALVGLALAAAAKRRRKA